MVLNIINRRTLNQGHCLKAGRILLGLSQQDLIKSCDFPLTQGTLSKIENGQLGIHAVLWQELVELMGFDPYFATEYGYFEDGLKNHKKLHQMKQIGDFKIPARYCVDQGSTVRTALPLLKKGYAVLGNTLMESWLSKKGFRPLYFRILNNPLNLNFIHDLIELLIEKNVLNKSDLDVSEVLSPEIHTSLHASYQKKPDPIEVSKKLIANSSKYQLNYDYQIQDISKDFLSFEISPRNHCKEFKANSEVLECAHLYRVHYFNQFASREEANSNKFHFQGDPQKCSVRIHA